MVAAISGVVPLIYNTTAGSQARNTRRLNQVVNGLHAVGIDVEVALVQSPDEVLAATAKAVHRGGELVLVCGGDGTVETAANAVIGAGTTLGILPAGTRNNVARSLHIPLDLKGAIAVLRTGAVQRIGAGHARTKGAHVGSSRHSRWGCSRRSIRMRTPSRRATSAASPVFWLPLRRRQWHASTFASTGANLR
ncbi:MAG: acylglycerol kinase family protein [Anaerolineales bacterium]|nr:acylglycerol kinase family protein [Anaerolineales bacterium]